MSVTDEVRAGESQPRAAPSVVDSQFDRTPPQDIAAEQCVLGGMLLSKDAIADVVEILRATDFYRPNHAVIFDAILDLYGRGEPADPITIAAALADAGELGRVGGAPYLHTLIAAVPTAANAAYYARIVAERAVLRRLVEAGTRIVQLGYGAAAGAGRDVDDVVDLAQQAVYDVTERRVSEDFAILSELLQPTLDEIEAVGSQSGLMTGVPTGFTDLDRLLNGLHPGQLIVVAGRPGLGKCLAGESVITEARSGRPMTIAEFVRRGRAGERLAVHTLGDEWRLGVAEPSQFLVNGRRPVLRLTTRSGRTIRATGNHPFRTVSQWRALAELRPGDHIAVPRALPSMPTEGRYRDVALDSRRPRDPTASDVTWDPVVSVEPAGEDEVYDLVVDGTHNFVANDMVVHNSTASMDFARNAAVRLNLASAIFSLEMSKVEIVMRLLSAEARVPLHVLRSGQLSDDDWTKLARRMGEISEAPLFVDDTPNLTLMEIRAKARRLKQRHDLKLVIVDYLQLMTSPKRVESRQQEVADLSRGLKLLAKEIDCPVVAVSQLNRGPEQRTDKRPQLSDLRESGCLTGATRVVRADNNVEVPLGELLASGARDIPVWALDEHLRYTPRTMTHVFPSGRRPVLRLRLASGRQIEGTANHPFLTFVGWTPLGELAPGSRVAIARHLPPPLTVRAWAEKDVVLLARLLGNGSLAPGFLPAPVFGLPKAQVALFLRHLWATDASVCLPGPDGRGRIGYGSTCPRMPEDIARLLLRFGITARLRAIEPETGPARYTLDICGRDDQLRFLREIGVHGGRARSAAALLAMLRRAGRGSPPVVSAGRVHHGHLRQEAAGRPTLARVAAALDTVDLDLHATNDVSWDEVVAIEPLGEQEVFDATVLGVHNFVANGIAVHNSIEQDADVVILLHRDDYYDRESPRAGEADFIVAKHRNGPTDTITVAAQLHMSRFVDMAVL